MWVVRKKPGWALSCTNKLGGLTRNGENLAGLVKFYNMNSSIMKPYHVNMCTWNMYPMHLWEFVADVDMSSCWHCCVHATQSNPPWSRLHEIVDWVVPFTNHRRTNSNNEGTIRAFSSSLKNISNLKQLPLNKT